MMWYATAACIIHQIRNTLMLHSHLSIICVPSSVIRPQPSVVRFSHYHSHLSVFPELWTHISVYRQFQIGTVRESGWQRHYLWGIPYPQLITMIYDPHPSSVKIAPGPILTDDGWRTTNDGLGVNGLSYFLPERFRLKRTTDGLTDRCEWGISKVLKWKITN